MESLFAGEKVYLEIKIDGEEIGKWVELASIAGSQQTGGLYKSNT